ncbi:MAG: glycosyltransferase [Anaerolineae bacterium]|nr:glycosyltransferase [Anaerolineae bacterium]
MRNESIVSVEYLESDKLKSNLRVAHISPVSGGVANAARRLHQGLLKVGIQSSLYRASASSAQAADHIYPFPRTKPLLRYADSASKLVNARLGLTGLTHVSSRFWSFPGADVIHLHGADARWFNLNALKHLGRQRPVVWTMHDQHLGTGGCGYPQEWDACEGWRRGCGDCPFARHEGWWLDLTHYTFNHKKAILESLPAMAVVAPNQWMLDFISTSAVTREQTLRRIPYGIDTEVFSPSPTAQARHELGLPARGKLLLSVATKLGQPRKGLQYYPPLLKRLRELNPDAELGLVLVGDQLPDTMLAEFNQYVPAYHLGHIDSAEQLAKAYSAADCFVITSRIDNFPNVVLESLACGTPAAGFRVGGLPDMIQPGKTGILADLVDTDAMADGISRLFNDAAELERYRAACRKKAVEHFSLELQAQQYVTLYEELVERLRAASRMGVPALRMEQP